MSDVLRTICQLADEERRLRPVDPERARQCHRKVYALWDDRRREKAGHYDFELYWTKAGWLISNKWV